MQEQANQLAVQFIQQEALADRLVLFNRTLNMDHERKICFVHNPKAMGTSLKAWLGLRIDNADHRFPTLMVNPQVWEQYTTICAVRHPVERFLSSFHFHCRSDYAGGYLRKFPELKSWDMERYFETMTRSEPYALAPQWKYVVHLRSEHPPDFLLRVGEHSAALDRIAQTLGISAPLPTLNAGKGVLDQPTPGFRSRLNSYYARDYEMFGYAL